MTDLARELRQRLRGAQADRLPSVAAAAARRGEIIWADAVGLAAEPDERATPDHQYRIASITKTFTAVAVLQLRDEGRLDLDDRLSDHIPAARKAPTIRRLLSHPSGIQREPPGTVWETLSFPTGAEPAVFERADADLYRGVSGRETGELLQLVRDAEGRVVKLYWATYPCTSDFRTFKDGSA